MKAANGVEALEILSNESVDVIVSDIMMPEMDGLELTTKIKTTIDYSHIPVILLTAKTTLESKVEGLECGADAYIDKPFSVRQLQMQIENLIKLRQSFHKMMIDLFGTQTEEVTTEYALSQKDREFIARIQEVITEQMADENFYIDSLAEVMSNPWTLKSSRILISKPEYEWERQWVNPDGTRTAYPIYVNESPQFFHSRDNRKILIYYSASGCWTPYNCIGMLTANDNSDLLNPASC